MITPVQFGLKLLLCMLLVLFFSYAEVHIPLHVTVSGCDSAKRSSLLFQILKTVNSTLIGKNEFLLNSINTHPIHLKISFLGDDADPVLPTSSDASFCFLDRGTLVDQNRAISRLHQSFARADNILPANSSVSPKPIFLIYEGSQVDHSRLNELAAIALRCEAVLNQPHHAQWLTSSEKTNAKSSIQPRLLLLPIKSNSELDEGLLYQFQTAWTTQLTMLLANKENTSLQNATISPGSMSVLPIPKKKNIFKRQTQISVTGIEKIHYSINKCEDLFRSRLSQMTQKLTNLGAGQSFANFINNNIIYCEQTLLEQELPSTSISAQTRHFASQTFRRNIATALRPLFFDKLETLTQEILYNFNNEVQDVQLSLNFIDELLQIQQKCLRQFQKLAEHSVPSLLRNARGEPFPSWSDIRHQVESRLSRVFGDYLKTREEILFAQQVLPLPRDRPHIDLSLNYFFLHPCGRDHRQSPLLFSSNDKLLFNSQLEPIVESIHPLCHILMATNLLKSKQHQLHKKSVNSNNHIFNLSFWRSRYYLKKLDQDAEFAREMLMFPLSTNIQAFPVAGSRSRDTAKHFSTGHRSANDLLQKKREDISPQLLMFGIEEEPFSYTTPSKDSTLQLTIDEIRNGLEETKQLGGQFNVMTQEGSSIGEKMLTVLFNSLSPGYKHPSANYGPIYSSQTSTL